MIPYRVFIAAIFILFIFLYRISILPETKELTAKDGKKIIVTAIYFVAGFFLVSSALINPTAWYGRILSFLGGLFAFAYAYIVHFYDEKEKQ